jgi:alpha-N-arabinofuranosidase
MANLAQMVNVIAPIFTSPQGLFLQPNFFPLELYRRESGDRVLHSFAEGPTFTSRQHGEAGFLDVCATRDERGALAIGVVNRHRDQTLRADFEIAGASPGTAGKVFLIHGPSPDSRNTFEQPRVVEVAARDHAGFGQRFSMEFPKHSISLLKL